MSDYWDTYKDWQDSFNLDRISDRELTYLSNFDEDGVLIAFLKANRKIGKMRCKFKHRTTWAVKGVIFQIVHSVAFKLPERWMLAPWLIHGQNIGNIQTERQRLDKRKQDAERLYKKRLREIKRAEERLNKSGWDSFD